jgi:hypothetical protein
LTQFAGKGERKVKRPKVSKVEAIYALVFLMTLAATIGSIAADYLTGAVGFGLIFVGVCVVVDG